MGAEQLNKFSKFKLLEALCILERIGLETYTHGVVCCRRPALLGGSRGFSLANIRLCNFGVPRSLVLFRGYRVR